MQLHADVTVDDGGRGRRGELTSATGSSAVRGESFGGRACAPTVPEAVTPVTDNGAGRRPQPWGRRARSSTTNSQQYRGFSPSSPQGGTATMPRCPSRGQRPGRRGRVVQSIDEERGRRRSAERIPPHNLEAEESLLGSMLLSRDAITAAVEARVDASRLLQAGVRAHLRSGVVALRAGRAGRPGHGGRGAAPGADCSRRSGARARSPRSRRRRRRRPTPAHYAKIVSELALLRRLITVSGEIAESRLQPARRRHRDGGPGRGDGLRGRGEAHLRVTGARVRSGDRDGRPARSAVRRERHDDRCPDRATPSSTTSCSGSSRRTWSSARPARAWARRASRSAPRRTSRW